jgi:hypothetical protein
VSTGQKPSDIDLDAKARRPATKRKFGTLKGRIKIIDPDWWKPISDEEVEKLLAETDKCSSDESSFS